MTTENIIRRKNLIKSIFNDAKVSPSDLVITKMYSDTLPLILKRYDTEGSLSGFIHANRNDFSQNFEINGPLGMGLQLRSELEGSLVLFAGGTGIFPFLDLLDFILKKSIYLAVKQMRGEAFAINLDILQQGVD